jgi:hypothetical protein
MEEKIKKIKVTKDSLIMVATFNRTNTEVEDIKPAKFRITSGNIFHRCKMYDGFEWTDNEGVVRRCYKSRARTPYPNVYDLFTISKDLSTTYLTPIQVKGDKIYNVPKITFHNMEGGSEVTHRLYFPEGDLEMYYLNVSRLESLQEGLVDTIWIEYSV